MEGKADDLLAAADDVLVAEAAGVKEGEVVVLGFLDKVVDLLEHLLTLEWLFIK